MRLIAILGFALFASSSAYGLDFLCKPIADEVAVAMKLGIDASAFRVIFDFYKDEITVVDQGNRLRFGNPVEGLGTGRTSSYHYQALSPMSRSIEVSSQIEGLFSSRETLKLSDPTKVSIAILFPARVYGNVAIINFGCDVLKKNLTKRKS
jgi:hypothetical protein